MYLKLVRYGSDAGVDMVDKHLAPLVMLSRKLILK